MQHAVIQVKEQENYRVKEAYRTLRTNIEFCGSDIKVIAVTSCTPNEGKSSVAVNMAMAMAEAGKKVMLIDADLRKSVLVGRYKGQNIKLGLTHCLAGRAEFADVMCSTNNDNLFMIFSGPVPPNPSELLGGKMFQMILQSAKKTFDYVIVDTPPLGSVIDGAIVARQCDGTMMVVESKAISYRFVQQIKDQLSKAECRILGVVLNKVDMSSNGYYGNYGKYYGKYYGKHYGKYGKEAEAEEAGE